MIRFLIAMFALCAFAAPALADKLSPDEQAQVRAIVRDYLVNNPIVLQEALAALEAKKAAERRVQIEQDPRDFSVGPKTAPITVVEFFDYRCPYCKTSMEWMLTHVRTRKDVRFVFKEFPILGPNSLEASQAAIASMKQGKYLAMHQALMSSRGELKSSDIDALARKVGVDVARMRKDMKDPGVMALIEANQDLAVASGVTGTPAFVINGEFIHGYAAAELDKALREATKTGKKTAAR